MNHNEKTIFVDRMWRESMTRALRWGRSRGVLLFSLTVMVLCMVATIGSAAQTQQPSETQLNAELGLTRSQVASPDIRTLADDQWAIDVVIDGQRVTLDVARHSVRSSGFQLLEAQPDGSLRAVDPGPERTIRGQVAQDPGSQVAGSLDGQRLAAKIHWQDGRCTWIEPLADLVEGVQPNLHVIYHCEDVLPTGKTCGNEVRHNLAGNLGDGDRGIHRFHGGSTIPAMGSVSGGAICQTELAIDSDHQYFDLFGSAAAVGARVAQIINTMNLQYEDEVGISHGITAIIVRPTADVDPYESNTTGDLLDEMTDLWENDSDLTGIPRDIAHLFTGRETGGVIGTAWIPGTCNRGFTYGVSQVEYNGIFSCATDLVAHEIGHNWNASHCNCPGFTMHPFIQCANTFTSSSIATITAYRDSIADQCLDCDGTIPPSCGNPGAGNCFDANDSPYCNDIDCCAVVCADDPFCCETDWDSICAGSAAEFCGDCGDPGAGDCFAANGTPGCENAECCELVCADDPFCCENNWDGFCADDAVEICAGCGGPLAGDCFSENNSPGCTNESCCNDVCGADSFCCDTAWDFLCANQAAETCGNCGDPAAGSCFEENGTPGCNVTDCCAEICANDPFCCEVEWDGLCASAADSVCGTCGGNAAGSCFESNGTPACNNAECCDAVCAGDPFCCDTDWDNFCASDAEEICATCGGAGAGSCFEFNATAACDNAECCEAVCAIDPFCCDTVWDNICASRADDECTGCGGAGTGSCCEPNGTPHCDDDACCELICDSDPFCCDTEWDGLCASAAINNCEPCFQCGSTEAGDCCESNGTPYCNDVACCDLICASDPFCCDSTWDSLCASAANEQCEVCPEDCPGDINGDSEVNVDDLLVVLNNWGPCAVPGDCPGDINGDSEVNVDDLLIVLNNWGPCP